MADDEILRQKADTLHSSWGEKRCISRMNYEKKMKSSSREVPTFSSCDWVFSLSEIYSLVALSVSLLFGQKQFGL